MSQPTGLSGVPSIGHCAAAATRASWVASSAAAKSPYRRTSAPRACGASSRSSLSVVGAIGLHLRVGSAHHLSELDVLAERPTVGARCTRLLRRDLSRADGAVA